MITSAYLLINCEDGFEEEIVNKLQQLPEIVEVYETASGVCDLIAKVSADTIGRLTETISWRIRRINKIISTTTLIAIEGQP